MPELSQLRQLVAFADCGTLSKAAEGLLISQPALSRAMQRLEEELGVTLFEHGKNKLSLNENGLLAVEQARLVLAQTEEMVSRVRAFDRAARTISVGSCAPAPLWRLLPALSDLFPEKAVSSEIKEEGELLQGLRTGDYQLIVLPFAPEDPELADSFYFKEQLHLAVPPSHPLAKRKDGVCFSDFDGETMLLFSEIGFWHKIPRAKLPHSRFLLQSDRFAFDELVTASTLPCFSTDISRKYHMDDDTRVHLPILDPEATARFHLVCRKKDRMLLKALLP